MTDSFETARILRELAAKYNGNFNLEIRNDKVVFTVWDNDLVKTLKDLQVMFS